MKAYFLFLLVLTTAFFSMSLAHADEGLLMESCGSFSDIQINAFEQRAYALHLGLRCEDLRSINKSISILQVAIAPAVWVLKSPGVSEAMAAELATLGLTMANPAVLGVTVIGAIGIGTFYVLLKQSLEDCEQEDREALKLRILSEVQRRYGIGAQPNVSLEISH